MIVKSIKERINQLEAICLKQEQVDCPVKHSFAPSLYIREVSLPKGAFVIGHEQKLEHFNVFLKGKVIMLNDDGTKDVLTAPMTYLSKPGRKIGFILEDTVWQNIYSTNEQDVEKLESMYLNKSQVFQEEFDKIELLKHDADILDFKSSIDLLGFNEEQVSIISEQENDMMDLPFGEYKFKKSKSNIHGYGITATSSIEKDEVIGPARIGEKRTILGRFVNHSINPNAEMIIQDGDIYLKAIRSIAGCAGGFDGEELTLDYKQAVLINLKHTQEVLCQA